MNHPDKVAVVDTTKGQEFTYGQLLEDAAALKETILKALNLTASRDLEERRIAFLTPNGYDYVVIQWAVWAAGGVCVPLCRCVCWSMAAQADSGRHITSCQGIAVRDW